MEKRTCVWKWLWVVTAVLFAACAVTDDDTVVIGWNGQALNYCQTNTCYTCSGYTGCCEPSLGAVRNGNGAAFPSGSQWAAIDEDWDVCGEDAPDGPVGSVGGGEGGQP